MKDRTSGHNEYIQASADFNKARNRALISKVYNMMNSQKDDLLSFHDVKEILKPKNQLYLGMKTVPIKLIVGSEGRYRDFNKYFLPRSEFLRHRWERVDRAQLEDVPLPAIQLYEIGGAYFVRDGNHRVSVARSRGIEEIDAEVISLSSEITITSPMTTDDLKKAVIDLEKKIFYEKTSFLEITGEKDLNFTTTGRYDKIYEQILERQYIMNQENGKEIQFQEAVFSWYNEIYRPIIKTIKHHKLDNNFPGKSPADIYLSIVRHWDFLKRKHGEDYSLQAAARNYSHRYGNRRGNNTGFFGKLAGFFGNRTINK